MIGYYDVYKGSNFHAIEQAAQIPVNDPLQLVAPIALATEHLGIGVTASTSFEHPYTFARRLSTADHHSKGRVGWNIVTSYLESGAKNIGQGGLRRHDNRYEVAAEYVEVLYKLLEGSWEDGAVLRDADKRVFTDPTKDVGATRAFIGFAKPGSPWIDLFKSVTDPQSARDVVVKLFATYFPEDAALVAQIEPLHEDPHSWFLGAVTPTVRRAAAATASGRPVAAIGDAAVSFDPIGGQGAQNAVIQSARLIRALRAYEGEITYEWLRDRFDSHWDYRVEAAAEVTRLFLGDPKYAAHGGFYFRPPQSTGALQARSSAFSPSRNPCSTSRVREEITQFISDVAGEPAESVLAKFKAPQHFARAQSVEAALVSP